MKSVKWLRLAVALAFVVTLLGTTPALAKRGWDGSNAGDKAIIELCNVGDEPRATGQATFDQRRLLDILPWGTFCTYRLRVTCQNLTPGATYSTNVGTFTADRKGNGKVDGLTITPAITFEYVVAVVRLDYDGEVTVLRGIFSH